MKSIVYLVGAGPGDPGLITVKAKKLIKTADVIVYDYLSNPIFITECKQSCELVNAGKRLGFKAMTQAQINNKLVSLAKSGFKIIVRLKGGDPLLFGRGGEEAEYLKKNNIKFEIVPGVTSAIAVPAYAGIPITHRDNTSSLSIVTGHEDPYKNESSIDWSSLSKSKSIVFLMGTKNLKKNISKLIVNGMSIKTPIAAIQWGTYYKQKTVLGNLKNIFSKIKENNIKSPSIIVIGDVCKYRKNLTWFEKKPLFGKKIVVTRARKNSSSLVEKIYENGGEAVEIPTIDIKAIKTKKNNNILEKSDQFDWLIFTSVNGVEEFFKQYLELKKDLRYLGNALIAAIGSETARSIERKGLKVDLIPEKFVAESLIQEFKKRKIKNKKILIPRASNARKILIDGLRKLNNDVKELCIYKSVLPDKKIQNQIKEKIIGNDVFGVTFTSSSTVENFFKFLDPKEVKKEKNIKYFCIGPITAKTLQTYGIKPFKIASKFTIDNLLYELIKSR